MDFDWMSSIIGYLLGTATGTSGMYYAEKLTDRRKKKESTKQIKEEFKNIKKQMPELIAEIKNDLSKPETKLIRKFFVLENRKVSFWSPEYLHFEYYEEDHKDLMCKIDLLESNRFIEDITTKNVPLYRMTEKFVEMLIKYG